MKRILMIMSALFLLTGLVSGQKFAFVDTEYILDNIPEYTEAQAQLDEMSNTWQKEIEAKFAEVDKRYRDYQAQSVLLPEDMKKKKEQEIIDLEKEAKNLQRTRFGKDGDLFKKRQELVKPIQEKIYNAIQEIATNGNYAVIFDKSGAMSMLYANPKYDVSDEVLDNLGASLSGRKPRSTGQATQPATGGTSQKPAGGSSIREDERK